jgi:hypothetical protein
LQSRSGELSNMVHHQNLPFAFIMWLLWLALCVAWIRWRWGRVRPRLRFDETAGEEGKGGSASSASVARSTIRERFVNLGRASLALLRNAGCAEADAGASAVRILEGAPLEVFSAMDAAVEDAIESAEVRSVMIEADSACVYFAVLPNRPEHLRLLNRNSTFAGGWLQHVNAVRASLMASTGISNIVFLLCAVNPLTLNSTLHVTCANAHNILIPSSLADRDDLAIPGVKGFDGRVDFNLAA